MKKVLYIYKSKYPWDVRVEKICKALSDSDFKVAILARYQDEKLTEEIINGIRVIRFGKGLPRLFSAPFHFNYFWKKKIEKTIQIEKPDVIIVREMHIAELAGKAAKKNGIPVIMDMAENYPAAMCDFKQYNSNFVKRFVMHTLKIPALIEKRAVNYMDAIITVCSEQNERLIKMYAFSNDNLAIVHNTPPKSITAFLKNDYDKKVLTLGHHGYLSADKSIINFVKAFAKYTENNDNLRLIIAGSGECLEDYKEVFQQNDTLKYVNFTGQYQPDELKNILSAIDIGIIPYKITDFNNTTIHNKVFDFWMNGQPVVLSATVPFTRIAEETNAALIVDCESEESIIRFFENIKNYYWNEMSKNAYDFAHKKYNWDIDSSVLIDFINRYIQA
jgi:glycosyltransferase involved in cell wall biosynthesis